MASVLYRLGAFGARHRLAFVIGWLCLVVWLVAGAVGGMSLMAAGASGDAEDFFKIPGAESSQALETMRREFPEVMAAGSGQDALTLVVQAPSGEQITSPANALALGRLLEAAAQVEHVAAVANPLDAAMPYVSADQTTAVATLTLVGVTDDNAAQIQDAIAEAAARSRTAGFTAEVGGALVDDSVEVFGALEAVGLGVAFVVLLVTLGSLVVAGMNMLTALVGVITGVLGALAYGALVQPIGPLTPALAVMLGLALGIDYGLFILTRFRAELREGHSVPDAAGRALATAGSSVAVAGCTVVTAVAALAVIGIPPITEIGLAAAFAVAIDVLLALTLLPAVMGFLGRRALTRRERAGGTRKRDSAEGQIRYGVLDRWALFVVRHRWTSLAAGLVLLGALAAPAVTMRTALSIPGGENPASSQRAAHDLVLEKFGGVQSPLLVLVEGPSVSGRLPAVTQALQELDSVTYVVPGPTTEAGTTGFVTVIPAGGPNDESTRDLVAAIRSAADSVSGVHLSVTGETAIGIDSDAQLREALLIYLAVVIGVCLLLLVVLFRSLLVPLIAAVGFLLSLGAALGVTVAVFQWGWGTALPANVGNPMMSFLPILVTGILFGLAMDYQIFLVSRMHEAYERGHSPREAILHGFGRSAPVVAAAAAIMTFVFGGFVGSPTMSLASISLALAVGVAADAFIVRMVLVPAALSVFGRAAWWLPRWLGRILPRLAVEGGGRPHQSPVDTREAQPALSR